MLVKEPDRKQGMIGLPHGIRVAGLASVQQIKPLSIHFCSFLRERDQGQIKLVDDVVDPTVTWRFPPLLDGNLTHLPMNGSSGAFRLLQGQSLNQMDQISRKPPRSARSCLARPTNPCRRY